VTDYEKSVKSQMSQQYGHPQFAQLVLQVQPIIVNLAVVKTVSGTSPGFIFAFYPNPN
jgi:hypothetical protein